MHRGSKKNIAQLYATMQRLRLRISDCHQLMEYCKDLGGFKSRLITCYTANISAVKNTLFACVLKAHVLTLYFLHQNKCKFYIRLGNIHKGRPIFGMVGWSGNKGQNGTK